MRATHARGKVSMFTSERRSKPVKAPHINVKNSVDYGLNGSGTSEKATILVASTIGDLMAFWNFKPSMGRVWTVLYLSKVPMVAEDIVVRT